MRETWFLRSIQGSAAQRYLLKIVECVLEDVLVGITGGHSNPNTANRDLDLGADFQELQSNGCTLRPLQVRVDELELQRGAAAVEDEDVHPCILAWGWIEP